MKMFRGGIIATQKFCDAQRHERANQLRAIRSFLIDFRFCEHARPRSVQKIFAPVRKSVSES